MYKGETIVVRMLEGQIAELCFDRSNEAVNKFDKKTLAELSDAATVLGAASDLKGLLISSAKDAFIVGADITEFGAMFQLPEDAIVAGVMEVHRIFNAIEDLPCPSVAAINGFALGGGFELALCADYRVMATTAQVGLPEVNLGIFPGYGGTVRLPRLIGTDNALEWIATAAQNKAPAALKVHAVDAVVEPEKLRETALKLLALAGSMKTGLYDWQKRRALRKGPLQLNQVEAMMAFTTAKGLIGAKAGTHMPAPLAAVGSVEKGATKPRDAAQAIEAAAFAKITRTDAATSLVGLFLADQAIKKIGRGYAKVARPVKHGAVLGAGIMGGGIAYQSAVRGVPVLMKDIAEKSIEIGLGEANKLLSQSVERGKLTPAKAGAVLSSIRPTMNYGDFGTVDIVIEAVVENPKIKKAVLAEVENAVKPDTVICSNTSSISIDILAADLKRPENFIGMHFFNPVHKMPLVEVITGSKTSREATATVVGYATTMGKTPIVVKDCPGFLVNRILFPYFFGFNRLIHDGADFTRVDRIMEGFGWPMGPAYLSDVVGIDTSHHVGEVLAAGYPDRMASHFRSVIDVMYEAKRLGQKNGVGFYKYEADKKGKPKKLPDPAVAPMIATIQPEGLKDFSDDEIIERMMFPMIIETARCLEEGIVGSAAEADMGLIMGIGFPKHLGGAMRYADLLGVANVVERCAKYASLGKLYEPTARMKEMAAAGERYFPF